MMVDICLREYDSIIGRGFPVNEPLAQKGYFHAKSLLWRVESELAKAEARTDLSPNRLECARRSYNDLMGQLQRELAEYEATLQYESRELVSN